MNGKNELARAEDARSAVGETLGANVIEAAKRVFAEKASTFKSRNGRDVGIEDDSGEKCWIIGHDAIYELEAALNAWEARAATRSQRGD